MTSMANFIEQKIDNHNAVTGKALPCHVVAVENNLVTVNFDILPTDNLVLPPVTIPVIGFEYIRYPIQIGDKGVTLAADVSLRGITGLGSGPVDLVKLPPLSTLFFVPLSNIHWGKVDTQVLTMYAKLGVTARTQDGSAVIDIKPNEVTITAPVIRLKGNVIIEGSISQEAGTSGGTASLVGPLHVQEGATVKGIHVETHTHTVHGVESGGSTVNTEVPK